MKKVEEKLEEFALDNDFSVNSSGCTGTLALVINDKLYIANVGDSKAFVFTQAQDTCVQLSVDHSPRLDSERERISSSGG